MIERVNLPEPGGPHAQAQDPRRSQFLHEGNFKTAIKTEAVI